jgi:hypothetical protein
LRMVVPFRVLMVLYTVVVGLFFYFVLIPLAIFRFGCSALAFRIGVWDGSFGSLSTLSPLLV